MLIELSGKLCEDIFLIYKYLLIQAYYVT